MHQWDGLHLLAVKEAIVTGLRRLPPPRGPVVDVWCGAKPYDFLFPVVVVGLDIDRRFGGADIVGGTPFPLRDASTDLALCSQALHILPPAVAEATLGELRRVVAPGGHIVVTVPGVMLRVGPASIEGRHSAASLAARFAGWDDVQVDVAGAAGAVFAHGLNLVVDVARRRLGLPDAVARPIFTLVNAAGLVVDGVMRPLAPRFPHILVLTARRPADEGA